MLQFNVERVGEGNPSGFDLGEMSFYCDGRSISSKSDERLRMMIYLSMVGLIDSLLVFGKKRKVNFVAVDSSFSVMFCVKGGGAYIESTGERMGPFPSVELMKSILDGIVGFVNGGGGLGRDDSVFGDFNGAIDDLKGEIERLQRL